MRSGTSFFNATIYRKDLTRFWPLWTANLVVWLLYLPLNALMRLRSQLQHDTKTLDSFARNLGDNATEFGLVFAVVFGLVVAMAVFSHLYSARSANFMGALPVRREGQFVSHYLAGLTIMLAPNVLVFLLTLLIEAIGSSVYLLSLGYWLLCITGMELFFFSFAVCLGQFAGHLLVLPVYYGVFNVLVLAVYYLFELVMNSFYYGFAGISGIWQQVAYWLTPALAFSQMDCEVYRDGNQLVQNVDGLIAVAVYAVAAVVLTICALLLYRRRHMESAGDVVAVKAMRPVFKYGVAACAGLFFGLVTSYALDMEEIGLMAAIILWGIAGYFVAQMLLDKSFRVFRKWKGAVVLTGAFLLLFAVIGFDLTGYEDRIPAVGDVASVEISGLYGNVNDSGSYLDNSSDDPEVIEKVVALHQAALDHRDSEESTSVEVMYMDEDYYASRKRWNFTVTYTLKNGSEFSREYSVYDVPVNAKVPGTVWYAVEQLTSHRDFMWEVYGFAKMEEQAAQGAVLTDAKYYGEKYYYENTEGLERDFSAAEGKALLEAVKADFAAGLIGRHSALIDEEKRLGTLTFEWKVPFTTVYEAGPVSFLVGDYTTAEVYTGGEHYYYVEIIVTTESVNTLAALDAPTQ